MASRISCGSRRSRDYPSLCPGVPHIMTDKSIRIAKFMAQAGLCSRREAERWIEDGRVFCNGALVETPATFIIPGQDQVVVDGEVVGAIPLVARLWCYHKPKGLLTTHSDPENRPTVFDSLPKELPRVVSVGRLDLNSEGLLLLTNKGPLARFLEHPNTGLERHYRVRAFGVKHLEQREWDDLTRNLVIDGMKYKDVKITLEKSTGRNIWLKFVLKEGKNREIRRIIEHVGGSVSRLIRTDYGPFPLKDLKEGAVKEIPPQRLSTLLQQCGFKETP
ncbi:MAG: rRNA pseudouridine synthase [bacterium]|nr:rRNA pseudouridine synthase [bacterium]